MSTLKPEHQQRLIQLFEKVPRNKLGVLLRYAFYDPFEPLDDAMDRISYMSDELVVSTLEEALPKAERYFLFER